MTDSPETNILIGLGDSKYTPTNSLKREADHLDNTYIWRSCCGMRLDKRVLVFFSQFSVGILIIAFSLYQLNKNDTCEHQQLYTGLLTMVLGIFLPSPRISK